MARMLVEHDEIRGRAGAVADLDAAHGLGELLHDHVRFEERELFALLERSGQLGRVASELA